MAGHNLIKMTELSELFITLGFHDVKTYIQSGNVIFSNTGNKPESIISANFEKAIQEKFKLTVSVMTRTTGELRSLFSVNPFLDEADFDPAKNAVIFLNEKPTDDQIRKVEDVDFPPDKFRISDREIFIYCPNGFGKTKLYTGFFEKKMGVIGTARNWKTITTILGLVGK
jgi:uncharacterized protein (DUF1697 family)